MPIRFEQKSERSCEGSAAESYHRKQKAGDSLPGFSVLQISLTRILARG